MKRPITPRGYDQLRRELIKLKAQRPELSRAIEVARGHGDLSENADYDAAKEKSGLVEAKIRDLEHKLSHVDIIDPTRIDVRDRLVFGLSAEIEDLDTSSSRTVSIVGPDESDVDRGWISCESPLGRALVGKQVGDVVEVRLPAGVKDYEIQKIFLDYSSDESHEQN